MILSLPLKRLHVINIGHTFKEFYKFTTINQPQAKNFIKTKKKLVPEQQKYRHKFINDYLFYKAVPNSYRSDELDRILLSRPLKEQYQGPLLECQKQGSFDHKGLKIATYTWEPPNNVQIKGVIVYFHSLNGHTLMVSEFAEKMSKKGYIITGMDYPNFGKSDSPRKGEVPNFTSVAEPSQRYFRMIKSQYPNHKIYMMGNSLGGTVAFCLANLMPNKDVSGIILLSPALADNESSSPLLKKFGFIAGIIFPKFRYWQSKTRNGSRMQLDEYSKKDPYIYREGMWSTTLTAMLSMMNQFRKQYHKLEKPYLIVQSGNDKLVDPFLAIDLERKSVSKDKTTVIIRDMWHNVWFDPRRDDVMKIVEEWLEQRED